MKYTLVLLLIYILNLFIISNCLYEDYKYFGLEVNNDNKEINDIVQYGLELIMKESNNTDNNVREISELINNDTLGYIKKYLDNNWRFVSNYHVTTIYDPAKKYNKIELKDCIEGKEQVIRVKGMIYVVNKILSLFVNVNTLVQNKIPHITILLNNNIKAKYSNDVLETVFGYDNYLKKYYYYYCVLNIELIKDIVIHEINMKIQNLSEIIHVVFFKNEFILHSIFKAYKRNK